MRKPPGRPAIRRVGSRGSAGALVSALAALAALALAGCAGTSSSTSEVSGGSVAEPAPARPGVSTKEGAPDRVAPDTSGIGRATDSAPVDDGSSTSQSSAIDLVNQANAVIATGTVSLKATDLAVARNSVRKVIDVYRGRIVESEIETDKAGEQTSVRLVLRIPTTDFARAIGDLEAISKFATVRTGEENVTTQVIDLEARIRAQEKSLARIETLLVKASTFSDVVAIEAQLTSRQAELESLKSQRAWLSDHTSMSTITVYLMKLSESADDPDEDGGSFSGFRAGLRSGWHTWTDAAAWSAAVLGAMLPFALTAGALGGSVWLLRRRASRLRAPTHGQDRSTDHPGAAPSASQAPDE
ncbi:MAG: DUF4349 domain-containing protein [Nocardioides sp.]